MKLTNNHRKKVLANVKKQKMEELEKATKLYKERIKNFESFMVNWLRENRKAIEIQKK